ncbi:MAG TPA: iron-sulfur cluster assembly scaffold protein [Gemmatimonadales bacterium]|jgi:nitrogen fixation NifU-like protein|nr:iron-sulfur cluster assembly scaffold protein [Gemmatimonadales bacterium]
MPSAPDRQTQIDTLVDHFKRPRHKGALEAPDATVPGGNPGCGDLVTIHLKADDDGRITAVRFEGEGCTISQAAASILADRVNKTHPTLDEVDEFSYDQMVDILGRDVVGFRERCATLALGTLKMAARKIQMHRRLRAAGRTDEEIRALEQAIVNARSDSGLVFGQAAEEQRGVSGADR